MTKLTDFLGNKAWVKAGDEYVLLDTVEVINIQEEIVGHDRVTFLYNDFEYTSLILISKTRPICPKFVG